jgi:transposase-like protein
LRAAITVLRSFHAQYRADARIRWTLCRRRHNVHLLRNSFRYASRRDWPGIARDLKPIYTAPTEAAALERLADFAGTWEGKYPAIIRLWEAAWAEFVPFLSFAPAVRQVIYTTNAIESVNARIRKAVKAVKATSRPRLQR